MAPDSITLVAIAKNERPYLLEWVAYHLAIGASRLIVYDNESTDGTAELLSLLGWCCPQITTRFWPSLGLHVSPQTSAYNHALAEIETDWVMFLDIDEFLVPYEDLSVPAFLRRVPQDASSVHINWRGFGSSERTSSDYGFVTTAFTGCAPRHWGNNHHFKSMARTKSVVEAFIHDVDTSDGHRVLSDFAAFETFSRGLSSRIAHAGIQLNHYQCKTYDEFRDRMNRGDANYHPEHRHRSRDASFERFRSIDLNECQDTSILVFHDRHRKLYDELLALTESPSMVD